MWLRSANGGYPKAMCDVGWMFSQGKGTPVNEKKAFEYMLKSAQAGYVRAQNNIGLYFKKGTGCQKNIRQAVYWLEKAKAANYSKLAAQTLEQCQKKLKEEQDEQAHAAVPPAELHNMGMKVFQRKDYKAACQFWTRFSLLLLGSVMCFNAFWIISRM